MRRRDSKRPRANPIARNTVTLDLAIVQAARSLARRIAVDNRSRDVVLVDALLGDGVGDDEAALRVAAESDLGVWAVGQGLFDEVCHHGPAAGAHLRVAGNRGRVVDALDGDAVGSEGLFQGGGEGGADGAAEVLGGASQFLCVLGRCWWFEDWSTYTGLGRTASEDERDWRTLAVFDVVASASAAAKAELALVDGRGHDDRSCVEQVGEGGSELHGWSGRVCKVDREDWMRES